MWQLNLEVQTKAKMEFIKVQKCRNTSVFQAFATQRNFIFVKYQIQDLVGTSIIYLLLTILQLGCILVRIGALGCIYVFIIITQIEAYAEKQDRNRYAVITTISEFFTDN